MKGTYRSLQERGLSGKINFNDWSDPLNKRLKHKNVTNNLTKNEKKSRLYKLKFKTAYSQTVNETDEIHLMVKKGEPLLPKKEIRLLRLPFYNSLVLNLKDDGYPATSEYIKELIVLDEMYGKHDPSRALLRTNKSMLGKLAEDLKVAEDAKRKADRTKEVKAFMDLAIYFMNLDTLFSWLAEELIEQSIDLLNYSTHPVHPQVEATVRFVYSSFLFDVVRDLEKAKVQLELSMKLSIGKNFWYINDSGEKGDIIFFKSCEFLSKIILEEAYRQKNIDLEKAIQSCRNSLCWAKQADNQSAIATALLSLADLYLNANQLSPVFDILQEHIKLCKNALFYRELCEGYVTLSKYHEAVGNNEEVVKVVEELISFALEHGIADIVMKAHIKLAEIYGIRRMGEMSYHATTAFQYCKQIGNKEKLETAKCLLGISQGDLLLCDYVNLVLISNDFESTHLKKLIGWKIMREPVFKEDSTILYQPEIVEILKSKRELERVKAEEVNNMREADRRTLTRTSTRSRGLSGTPNGSNMEAGQGRPSRTSTRSRGSSINPTGSIKTNQSNIVTRSKITFFGV